MMAATRSVPDLVVEVLSRSTEARDRSRKMDLLARFGVPEYWIVDPVNKDVPYLAWVVIQRRPHFRGVIAAHASRFYRTTVLGHPVSPRM